MNHGAYIVTYLVKERIKTRKTAAHTCNGSLLKEPWKIKKDDGTSCKVFTSFYCKGRLNIEEPLAPLPKLDNVSCVDDRDHLGIDALDLLPKVPWDKQLELHWDISEKNVYKRFETFINKAISFYKDDRNLSVNLNYRVYYFVYISVKYHLISYGIEHFCGEPGWRGVSFSYSPLYHNPEPLHKNLQSKFDDFPWPDNADSLRAW